MNTSWFDWPISVLFVIRYTMSFYIRTMRATWQDKSVQIVVDVRCYFVITNFKLFDNFWFFIFTVSKDKKFLFTFTVFRQFSCCTYCYTVRHIWFNVTNYYVSIFKSIVLDHVAKATGYWRYKYGSISMDDGIMGVHAAIEYGLIYPN